MNLTPFLQESKTLIFIVLIVLFWLSIFYLQVNKQRKPAILCILGILIILTGYYVYQFGLKFSQINEWDFLAFYVYGKLGAEGLPIYDPASFNHFMPFLDLPNGVSAFFNASVLSVGFVYPPTTMLLLAPIGYLDLSTAVHIWKAFILITLLTDIVLIYYIYKIHKTSLINLLIITTLILLLPGSSTTVALSQTNFLLLFLIVITLIKPDSWKAGIYLALGVVVKPIAVLWALYFLIRRKWAPVISFSLTGLVLVILTIVWFGLDNFLAFFTTNPTSRLPAYVYDEGINQSMNAIILRISSFLGLTSGGDQVAWMVLILSVVMVVAGAIASVRLLKRDREASFLLLIPLSLLVYPGCLSHYAVLLLPVLFSMIVRNSRPLLFLILAVLVTLSFSSFAACLVLFVFFLLFSFNKRVYELFKPATA